MKPVRLSEFGCAAVDRGGNAPNLFQDPKSSESHLPHASTGARDDGVQRAALEAVLGHFGKAENNPTSAVYGGPMLEAADAWCWDARPYPAFPARGDVWADAGAWRAGHWLNGRLAGDGRDLIAAVLERGGLKPDEMSVEGASRGRRPAMSSTGRCGRATRWSRCWPPSMRWRRNGAGGSRSGGGGGRGRTDGRRPGPARAGRVGSARRGRWRRGRPQRGCATSTRRADYQTGAVVVRVRR